MNYIIISLKSSNLSPKQVISICKLKNQYWKFGLRSQKLWFKRNVKNHDVHNLVYSKSKLVGYTLLRIRKRKISSIKKLIKYLLFDTLIIDKKFRKKKISELLMKFNNSVIKKKKLISFLICQKKMINFYKKYGWVKLNNQNIKIENNLSFKNCMVYNQKNNNKQTKQFIYISK